jgi:ribosomal protein L1
MNEQFTIQGKIAKVSMKPEQIKENFVEFLKAVYAEAKNISSTPFKSITLSPSMGPSVKLDVNSVMESVSS